MTVDAIPPHRKAAGLRRSVFDVAFLAQGDFETASRAAAALTASVPPELRTAVRELAHAAIDFGILGAFLDAAKAHATTRTRPWPGTGYDKASDDPHLIRRFGRFVASCQALEALLDEAVEAVEQHRPGAEIAAANARNHALFVGRTFISEMIELLGASAASGRFGFDAYWRTFAAHARTEPPALSAEALGGRLIRRTAEAAV